MRAAEKAGTEECPVKMKLLAPPLYVLTTNTLEKNKGVEVLVAACEAAKSTVETRKGRLIVKEAARAVSERDDRLLNDQVSLSPSVYTGSIAASPLLPLGSSSPLPLPLPTYGSAAWSRATLGW